MEAALLKRPRLRSAPVSLIVTLTSKVVCEVRKTQFAMRFLTV